MKIYLKIGTLEKGKAIQAKSHSTLLLKVLKIFKIIKKYYLNPFCLSYFII